MKLTSVPIAAAAALALSLPAPAFAQSSDAPGRGADDVRTNQQLMDRVNSLPVVADPKAPATNRAPLGTYPIRRGIILMTPDKFMGLPLGHAAIVYTRDKVVESVSQGVIWGPNNWNRSKDQAVAATVKATSNAQDEQAATWASHQRRKPYNYNYADKNTRSRFYCSQLVWAAFKDNFGINLDTPVAFPAVHPAELIVNDKVKVVYRKK